MLVFPAFLPACACAPAINHNPVMFPCSHLPCLRVVFCSLLQVLFVSKYSPSNRNVACWQLQSLVQSFHAGVPGKMSLFKKLGNDLKEAWDDFRKYQFDKCSGSLLDFVTRATNSLDQSSRGYEASLNSANRNLLHQFLVQVVRFPS